MPLPIVAAAEKLRGDAGGGAAAAAAAAASAAAAGMVVCRPRTPAAFFFHVAMLSAASSDNLPFAPTAAAAAAEAAHAGESVAVNGCGPKLAAVRVAVQDVRVLRGTAPVLSACLEADGCAPRAPNLERLCGGCGDAFLAAKLSLSSLQYFVQSAPLLRALGCPLWAPHSLGTAAAEVAQQPPPSAAAVLEDFGRFLCAIIAVDNSELGMSAPIASSVLSSAMAQAGGGNGGGGDPALSATAAVVTRNLKHPVVLNPEVNLYKAKKSRLLSSIWS